MRNLLFVAVLGLCACDGDDDGGSADPVDANPGGIDGGSDVADASLADCEKPTSGHYAFVRAVDGRSRLLRLGDGADDFDEEIGAFVFGGGGNAVVTQILHVGDQHHALAGMFLLGYDQTVVEDGEIVVSDVATLSDDLDVAGPAEAPYFLGVRDNQLFCIDARDGEETALGPVGTACPVLAIRGTCEPDPVAPWTANLVADCPEGATYFTMERPLESSPQIRYESDPLEGVHDVVGLPTDTLLVTADAELYDIDKSGFTLRRKTRLCVGPGNPFNGQQQAVTGTE